MADFDKAFENNIDEPSEVYDGMGQCFLLLKDYEKAEENFTDSIKLDMQNDITKRNGEPLRNRAKCYIEQDKFAQAVEDLMEADKITQNPRDPQILYELGITHFLDKKYRKCLKFLKDALRTE